MANAEDSVRSESEKVDERGRTNNFFKNRRPTSSAGKPYRVFTFSRGPLGSNLAKQDVVGDSTRLARLLRRMMRWPSPPVGVMLPSSARRYIQQRNVFLKIAKRLSALFGPKDVSAAVAEA